jgi:hypothetical protein
VSRPTLDGEQSRTNYGRRFFSFYDDPPNANQKPNMGNPAYTVYGEEIAFTLKAIPPEFRSLPSGTVILDASKRGRLLFEWTPLASGHDDGYGSGNRKYRWDASTRFALTAEEAGSLLAKLDRGDPSVEFSRRVSGDSMGQSLDKVFIAKMIELEGTKNDGISLLMDYVDSDKQQLGQVPHPQSGEASDGAFGNEGLVSNVVPTFVVLDLCLCSCIRCFLPSRFLCRLVGSLLFLFALHLRHRLAPSKYV